MNLAVTRFDRILLCVLQHVVPKGDRAEWLRGWQSELWYLNHGRRADSRPCTSLTLGMTRDALWLRTEALRRATIGTAGLCLAGLALLNVLSGLAGLLLVGSYPGLMRELSTPFHRFLFEGPLVAIVTFGTTPRRHIHRRDEVFLLVRRLIFLLVKTALILQVAFLLSAEVCHPLHDGFPLVADLTQILLAAIFSIGGLRWAANDQYARCKLCLRCLESPAQIGRPSHNLLEWNGTEQICRRGHGQLNLPEMETSWCQAGHWIQTNRAAPSS